MIGEDGTKHLNRVFYERYLEHGLVEIYLGILFISFLLFYIPGFYILAAYPFMFMGFIGPYLWKKIIAPRLGYVKWGGLGSGKSNKLAILLFAITAAFFIFIFILIINGPRYPSDWEIEMHLIIIGIVGLTICSITGFISGVQRFYYYGIVTLLIFNMAHLFNASAILSFVILGIFFLVVGFYLLIRFLKNHPVIELEGEDGDQ